MVDLAAARMVDLAAMSGRKGSPWGLFHDMGHNHQSRDWTFDGTVEVTCNLFTLYVLEKVCGIPPGKARKGFPLPAAKIEAYRATGPDFAVWKRSPFLALTMYAQLREAFGWDAFRRVFREYRDLPPGERP